MNIEKAKLALSTIKFPVKYDGEGYIRDADFENVCEVRGWGRIQYMERPVERQNAIGELLAALLNEENLKARGVVL